MKNQAYLPSFLLVLFLCSAGLFSNLSAQGGFEMAPNTFEASYTDIDLSDEYLSFRFEGFMANTSSEPIEVQWERFILEPCPETWDIFVSDINISYLPWISTNSFPIQLSPGDSGQYFVIDIFPRSVAGCCDIEIVFSDFNDPENILDTAFYSIQINDALCSTTGTEGLSFESAEITVYPNPAATTFSMDTAIQPDQIILCNSMGQQLKTFPFREDNSYSIQELPKGLYFLKHYLDGQLVGGSRLVKGIR